MTAEEQQMLQGLADRINKTVLADRDSEAENLIGQTLERNPDALYIMAQTILVQGHALEQAQKQIANLDARLGQDDDRRNVASTPPPPAIAGYGAGLTYPSGGYPIAGDPEESGGFLRSAMQTATGVGAGGLVFEGIESLMQGFGHESGDRQDRRWDTALDANRSGKARDASSVTDRAGDADELSGTEGTDYSSEGDDSMLADDVGSGEQG